MHVKRYSPAVALAGIVLLAGPAAAGEGTAVPWEAWSDRPFARAAAERRFVLLDVGAEWCHWCHVMDETTYREAEVLRLIRERFVPVRVDADAQPDLANRYEDYGWPATVVFDAEGREIVKFRGYITPGRMRSLLAGIVEDPRPGPSAQETDADVSDTAPPALTDALRAELVALHAARYDALHGGWGFVHKYLDADAVEYALRRARDGDRDALRMAQETLGKQARHLIDPVWGGAYQYSDSGVWENPHFEKIASVQADNLRAFSLAYAQTKDAAWRGAADDVLRYLRAFWKSPQGAFYVSQDADLVPGQHSAGYFAQGDAERRKRGLPRIDTNLYTRENGWIVRGLVAYFEATGDRTALAEAEAAARFVVAERALPGGGFRHDAQDPGGPYLGDNASAARAFLDLHRATNDPAWLARAEETAAFVDRTFRVPGLAGYVTARPSHAVDRMRPQRDENVALARLGAALAAATGRPAGLDLASHALRYLASPEVARRFATASVLLADEDVARAAASRTAAR
jgi:uncharacterized protein YyaL (SSP411 family)